MIHKYTVKKTGSTWSIFNADNEAVETGFHSKNDALDARECWQDVRDLPSSGEYVGSCDRDYSDYDQSEYIND